MTQSLREASSSPLVSFYLQLLRKKGKLNVRVKLNSLLCERERGYNTMFSSHRRTRRCSQYQGFFDKLAFGLFDGLTHGVFSLQLKSYEENKLMITKHSGVFFVNSLLSSAWLSLLRLPFCVNRIDCSLSCSCFASIMSSSC